LEASVHPKVVSEARGHASVAFTMDRNQHVMPTMQETAASAIQQGLGPGGRHAESLLATEGLAWFEAGG
jgi:hypothetical protein